MNLLFALAILAALSALFLNLGISRSQTTPPLPPADDLPGGDPSRAIPVRSPTVIEHQAERWPCLVCQSQVRCDHHRVEHLAERRLRVARVRCPRCGFERDIYFDLRADLH